MLGTESQINGQIEKFLLFGEHCALGSSFRELLFCSELQKKVFALSEILFFGELADANRLTDAKL